MSDAPSLTRPATTEWFDRPGPWLFICGAVYLPFALAGFGTDIDVPNVLRSGRSLVEDGRYQMSRGPGSAVYEAGVGVLERIGGSVLVNLASLWFALLGLWCIQALLRADGARWGTGGMLVLATNPWFWVAATSLGDFTWALGLGLSGAVASQRSRPVAAGVLWGLALGCRVSTLLVVVAWIVAQYTARPPNRVRKAETACTLVVFGVVAVMCFLLPWLEADRTMGFVTNQLATGGFVGHLGRWATKNLAVFGVVAGVVLIVGARGLLDGLRRWPSSQVVRFAVIMGVLTEVLFFRFPFKPLHLLPAVAALALWVGSSPLLTRRWIGALLVAQLSAGVLGVAVASPDVTNNARSGRWAPDVTSGVVLTDVRCRLEDRRNGPWSDPSSVAAVVRAARNANCQSTSWRAP